MAKKMSSWLEKFSEVGRNEMLSWGTELKEMKRVH